MKFWTLQTEAITNTVMSKGGFQPVLSESEYLESNPKMSDLYSSVLSSFNRVNDVNLPGLVFAFSGINQSDCPAPIPDAENFVRIMKGGREAIRSLWKHLRSRGCLILELDVDLVYNPLYIDINDFQMLMPPVMILHPFTENDIVRINASLECGIYTPSPLPSGIIQSHLPYIKREYVKNIYNMFDLD